VSKENLKTLLTSNSCQYIIELKLTTMRCQGGESMKPRLSIKLKRIERGFKQFEFAGMIGISREYLRLIETGKATNPSISVMKKIAETLEASVQELFF
jgi:putative transcriptional regulator